MERSCYPKSLSLNTKTSPPQSPLNFPLDQETDLSGLKLKAWKIIKLLFSVTKSHNKIMFPHHPPEGENLRPNKLLHSLDWGLLGLTGKMLLRCRGHAVLSPFLWSNFSSLVYL